MSDNEYLLDVIEVCVQFTEYPDIEAFNEYQGTDYYNYNEIDDYFILEINGKAFIVIE